MELLHYGASSGLPLWAISALCATTLLAAVFVGAPMWLCTALVAVGCWTFGAPWWLATLLLLPCVVIVVPALRRPLLSDRLLALFRRTGFMPQISDPERAAIAAGTVWLDGELLVVAVYKKGATAVANAITRLLQRSRTVAPLSSHEG